MVTGAVDLGTGLRRKGRTGRTSFSGRTGDLGGGGGGGGESVRAEITDGTGEPARDDRSGEVDFRWGSSIEERRRGIVTGGGGS